MKELRQSQQAVHMAGKGLSYISGITAHHCKLHMQKVVVTLQMRMRGFKITSHS